MRFSKGELAYVELGGATKEWCIVILGPMADLRGAEYYFVFGAKNGRYSCPMVRLRKARQM